MSKAYSIIGFAGKMGTGKTTLARYLANLYWRDERDCLLYSFANQLRQEVMFFYNLSERNLREHKNISFPIACAKKEAPLKESWKKSGVFTPREVLQYYGTDIRRAQDPDYWIKQAKIGIKNLIINDKTIVIIDDVRFNNEVEFCREHNGIVVYLKPYEGYLEGEGNAHASENAITYVFDLQFSPGYGNLLSLAHTLYTNIGESK